MDNSLIPFVSYYEENNISPVSQDISDLNKHLNRRGALHRHLGIPPSFLKGKKVLEIGPGSGFNSLFTLHCRPERYLLVDGNPVGVKETTNRLAEYAKQMSIDTDVEVQQHLLQDFETSERFDLVWCEGMLSPQIDPQNLVRRIVSCSAGGGVIVVTCCCELSFLSDMLKRVMGRALVDASLKIHDQARSIEPFFRDMFKHLSGMSRPVYDFILDNVLQPYYGEFLSIDSAVDAVEGIADVYGASPNFLTDWRWYKDINQADCGTNAIMKRLYWENVHNFIDYETHFSPRTADENMCLIGMRNNENGGVKKFYTLADEFQHSRDKSLLEPMAVVIDTLAQEVSLFQQDEASAKRTAARLRDSARILRDISSSKQLPDIKVGESAFLFGRGQQYISFIKR